MKGRSARGVIRSLNFMTSPQRFPNKGTTSSAHCSGEANLVRWILGEDEGKDSMEMRRITRFLRLLRGRGEQSRR